MSAILTGVISGAAFGAFSVATMIPLKMEERKTAMLGGCADRFAIGFVICNSSLPVAGWLNGIIFGALLSLPSAIITRSWIPIMTFGILGGIVIGVIVGR